MCGLTGFLDPNHRLSALDMTELVEAMADSIHRRGPDDSGTWIDPDCGVAFGFRRLAIVDLSHHGHQPMLSASGRFAIVFNGEIYNYSDLRRELEQYGYRWRGGSDTEVLLAAIETWGLSAALMRAVGMFALALWDREERVLRLARDRMGEKPLYYGWCGEMFLFGSELKALQRHPAFTAPVDRDAVALFLRHGYIPAPSTIFDGICKLLPASIATLRLDDATRDVKIASYWSLADVARRGTGHPFDGSDAEAQATLDTKLRMAVRGQMMADVPVGAFLSGGIDSSTLVALMQAESTRPVRTFTIGFGDDRLNEAEYARAIARHLGTEHTELVVSPMDALDVIPRLPEIYDEPFADPSQIPTVILAQLTKQHVTVSLSGDGGDELFCGYDRYFRAERMLHSTMSRLPSSLRQRARRGLTAIPPRQWDRLFELVGQRGPLNGQASGHRVHVVADLLAFASDDGLYRDLMSTWPEATGLVRGASSRPTRFTDPTTWTTVDGFMQRMMYLDQIDYLPDDLLVKVDRASMYASLESRAPFLDHRLIEFAWCLPQSMNVRNRTSKWLLRQVLNDYVPSSLVDRPKMGFAIPLADWLRGPLRPWAEELLDERRLRDEGFLDPGPIRVCWQEHLSGTRDWKHRIWNVLMFQSWLAQQSMHNTGTPSSPRPALSRAA